MFIHIALFRGINVGGNSILPMTELVAILQDLGCREVKTYIQSGNAVFVHPTSDQAQLARQISLEIKSRRGFEPRVLLLTRDELENAIAANPFPEAEANPAMLHLGFLSTVPQTPNLPALEKLRTPNEQTRLIDKVFYLYAPDGIGRSKLAAAEERALGVPLTDRNWNTVVKLAEMARVLSSSK